MTRGDYDARDTRQHHAVFKLQCSVQATRKKTRAPSIRLASYKKGGDKDIMMGDKDWRFRGAPGSTTYSFEQSRTFAVKCLGNSRHEVVCRLNGAVQIVTIFNIYAMRTLWLCKPGLRKGILNKLYAIRLWLALVHARTVFKHFMQDRGRIWVGLNGSVWKVLTAHSAIEFANKRTYCESSLAGFLELYKEYHRLCVKVNRPDGHGCFHKLAVPFVGVCLTRSYYLVCLLEPLMLLEPPACICPCSAMEKRRCVLIRSRALTGVKHPYVLEP